MTVRWNEDYVATVDMQNAVDDHNALRHSSRVNIKWLLL
jgi:hypothetical protein